MDTGSRQTSTRDRPLLHRGALGACLVGMMAVVVPADAGWLDTVRSKVKQTVDQAIRSGSNGAEPQSEEPAAPARARSEGAGPAHPPAEETATLADDAAQLVALAEAPAGSPSVLDIPLKGVRLGMPARLAHATLTQAGFGYQASRDAYQMEARTIGGKTGTYRPEDLRGRSAAQQGELVKRYTVTFLATEVSDDLVKELDEDRQAMVREAQAIYLREKAEQDQAASTRSRRRGRRGASADSTRSRFAGQPVQLIYYLEYRQVAGEGRRWDHAEALSQARQAFGEPSYTFASLSRQGAAYQTSPEHNLVYADVLLTSAAEREAMVQRAAPGEQYVMKQGLNHPCSGVLRGRCPNGAHPESAYPGDLDMQLKLARLQFAPFMLVLPHTSRGLKVIQEWQYLLGGDTVRRQFRSKNAEAAKPKAKAEF